MYILYQMKAKITFNCLLKLVLRFTLEKVEKLSFQKNHFEIIWRNFSRFFPQKVPKNEDSTRTCEYEFSQKVSENDDMQGR